MFWPLKKRPIPKSEMPFFNKFYAHMAPSPRDPTMTWGTELDATNLQAYIRKTSVEENVILSPVHVLVKAVGMALVAHPHLNRRPVGRRVYDFKHFNALMSYQNRKLGQPAVMVLKDLDQKSLKDIAGEIWQWINRARRGEEPMDRDKRRLERFYWLMGVLLRGHRWISNRFNVPVSSRVMRYQTAAVHINCLNYPGAPPLRSYKATQVGVNSWAVHVAMGPMEDRPVAVDGEVVVRPMLPIFVRVDHRMADAVELGQFTGTIRDYMTNPETIPGAVGERESADGDPNESSEPRASSERGAGETARASVR